MDFPQRSSKCDGVSWLADSSVLDGAHSDVEAKSVDSTFRFFFEK